MESPLSQQEKILWSGISLFPTSHIASIRQGSSESSAHPSIKFCPLLCSINIHCRIRCASVEMHQMCIPVPIGQGKLCRKFILMKNTKNMWLIFLSRYQSTHSCRSLMWLEIKVPKTSIVLCVILFVTLFSVLVLKFPWEKKERNWPS